MLKAGFGQRVIIRQQFRAVAVASGPQGGDGGGAEPAEGFPDDVAGVTGAGNDALDERSGFWLAWRILACPSLSLSAPRTGGSRQTLVTPWGVVPLGAQALPLRRGSTGRAAVEARSRAAPSAPRARAQYAARPIISGGGKYQRWHWSGTCASRRF